MSPLRIMVFYDGGHVRCGQAPSRGGGTGRLDLAALQTSFGRWVADKTGSPPEVTMVVGGHYYDGRASTRVADNEHLENERNFELALKRAGIEPHYSPLREQWNGCAANGEPEYEVSQKGVDTALIVDALDMAYLDRFDVCVLLSGDGDFVPLVRRLTQLGKYVLIAHFETRGGNGVKRARQHGTNVSRALVRAATWSLNLSHLAGDARWHAVLKSRRHPRKGAA